MFQIDSLLNCLMTLLKLRRLYIAERWIRKVSEGDSRGLFWQLFRDPEEPWRASIKTASTPTKTVSSQPYFRNSSVELQLQPPGYGSHRIRLLGWWLCDSAGWFHLVLLFRLAGWLVCWIDVVWYECSVCLAAWLVGLICFGLIVCLAGWLVGWVYLDLVGLDSSTCLGGWLIT